MRLIRLEVQGHAGAGVPGEDVVCAGVSALVQSFMATVVSYRRTAYTQADTALEKGLGLCEVICRDRKVYRELEQSLLTVIMGLRLIAEQYPAYISIECKP